MASLNSATGKVTGTAAPTPTPFKIAVSDELLGFVTERVKTSRIPPPLTSSADGDAPPTWRFGIPPSSIAAIRDFWRDEYDWRAVERRLNATLEMFTLGVEHRGEVLGVHFVWRRSERGGAIPLLFQHGWPGSFLEVEKIISSLTNPPEGQQAYHVVAPSLPGFAFSEGSKRADFNLQDMAAIDHKLMLALGYEKYVAQGGDWGSMIVRIIGLDYPESCVGVHVNALVSGPPVWWKNPLSFIYLIYYGIKYSKDRNSDLGRMLWWMSEESGYFDIQGTKPQTLSYALTDSPLGMMAWIRDKMEPFGADYKWSNEDVITWAMMYIIPGSANQAHIYTNVKCAGLELFKKFLTERILPKEVDFGASIFPKDVLNIPQWWAECTVSHNITFWREHTSGGHFASIEKPDILVQDIRDFTAGFKEEKLLALRESGKLKR